MSNKVKDLGIKNLSYYFFSDTVNTKKKKKLLKKIMKQMESHIKIFLFTIFDM